MLSIPNFKQPMLATTAGFVLAPHSSARDVESQKPSLSDRLKVHVIPYSQLYTMHVQSLLMKPERDAATAIVFLITSSTICCKPCKYHDGSYCNLSWISSASTV